MSFNPDKNICKEYLPSSSGKFNALDGCPHQLDGAEKRELSCGVKHKQLSFRTSSHYAVSSAIEGRHYIQL